MKRRHFLKYTSLFGTAGLSTLGSCGWAWRGAVQAADHISNQTETTPPRLVVIFLRGAADGLNIVVPYQDPLYYKARPTIAIAKPGEPDGVIDLDGQFGLHPALDTLMPQWQSGHLAFIHASGSPVSSRSHFQAQDYWESGTPGDPSVADGWLNRLLAFLPSSSPTQAVNIGGNMPLILTGKQAVTSLALGAAGSRPLQIDRHQIQAAFDQLYSRGDRLSQMYQEGRIARDMLLGELNTDMMEASRGAPSPEKFVTTARYLAQLMAGDSATQVAFMELGEWDTHVNERRLLQRNLESLGTGLAAMVEELGDLYQKTVIVVMSEFGRTVSENGNGGTDHGHGNALWLMGGSIRGQQVYGDWPGLDVAAQHQSRDLAITTDFRDVLSSMLGQHFDLSPDHLAQIFPGYQTQQTLQLL